jgi:hypothetical protein
MPGVVPEPPPPYPGPDPVKPEDTPEEEPDDKTKSDEEKCTKTTVSDCTTIYSVAVTGSKRDLVTTTMTTTSCGPAITACDRTARNTEITTSSVDVCSLTTISSCTTLFNVSVTSGASGDMVTNTVTTTSCGSAITACSTTASNTATTSSSTPTATGVTYRIRPKLDAPFAAVQEFTEKLKREISVDTLWISGSELGKFIVFWSANLTPDQADAYKADPIVSVSFVLFQLDKKYENKI